MKYFLIPVAALTLLMPATASAQDKAPAPSAVAAAPAAQQPDDLEQRLDLAKKMHEIQPANAQVVKAIEQVSQQLPPQDREAFKNAMMKSIDDVKLETLSVKVMAETFTAPELERMLSYFSSPEARAISEKMPVYNGRMQPEIMKMLDAAMMAARTGGGQPAKKP